MKKKIDLVDQEHNSEKWKSGSFDDESGNKEPTIKDLLSSLFLSELMLLLFLKLMLKM